MIPWKCPADMFDWVSYGRTKSAWEEKEGAKFHPCVNVYNLNTDTTLTRAQDLFCHKHTILLKGLMAKLSSCQNSPFALTNAGWNGTEYGNLWKKNSEVPLVMF